jgi:hypothetical protein
LLLIFLSEHLTSKQRFVVEGIAGLPTGDA